MRRMTRNPVQVISCSSILCQSVNGRSEDVGEEMAGVPVALTTSIVAFPQEYPGRHVSDRRLARPKRAHGIDEI